MDTEIFAAEEKKRENHFVFHRYLDRIPALYSRRPDFKAVPARGLSWFASVSPGRCQKIILFQIKPISALQHYVA
jgi:hypothetical protein